MVPIMKEAPGIKYTDFKLIGTDKNTERFRMRERGGGDEKLMEKQASK